MRSLEFDPFGEPVAASSSEYRAGKASRIALRSGVGLFWLLVAGIVVARAAYFDPNFAETFGNVAALVKSLQAVVGV